MWLYQQVLPNLQEEGKSCAQLISPVPLPDSDNTPTELIRNQPSLEIFISYREKF